MPSKKPVCVFFDVDDTLYPPQSGVWAEISRRIHRYIVERIGLTEAEAELLRERYFAAYGTTCNGLRCEHGTDPREYYRYVHDIPLDRFLSADPALRRMLTGLPHRKFIFSNGDRAYITRVLSTLGVADCFEGIIDIFDTGFACKPMNAAYLAAARLAGSPPAEHCILVDDLERNLPPAQQLGWTAILVHHPSADPSNAHRIETIYQLPEKLIQLGFE